MKLTLLLARWFASPIRGRTRLERRAFREYSRQELDRLRVEEIRAGGLRLCAAWSTQQEYFDGFAHKPSTPTAL